MRKGTLIIAALALVSPALLMANPADTDIADGQAQGRGAWLKDASEQDILNRIRQALGTQDIDVTDRSKLMGIAKGLGLIN